MGTAESAAAHAGRLGEAHAGNRRENRTLARSGNGKLRSAFPRKCSNPRQRDAFLRPAKRGTGLPSRPTLESERPDGIGIPSYAPRYELGAYVVMPNHLHAVLRPLDPETHSLESILGSWKRFISRRINYSTAKSSGNLWQQESFDRIIRDEEHLWRTIQYIGRNPELAGLPRIVCPRWIRPEWEALGWRFEL